MQPFRVRIQKELLSLPEILIVAYWAAHVAFALDPPWLFVTAISVIILAMNVLLPLGAPSDPADRTIASVLGLLIWLGVGWFGRNRASTADWILYGIATAILGWRLVNSSRQARAVPTPERRSTGPGT